MNAAGRLAFPASLYGAGFFVEDLEAKRSPEETKSEPELSFDSDRQTEPASSKLLAEANFHSEASGIKSSSSKTTPAEAGRGKVSSDQQELVFSDPFLKTGSGRGEKVDSARGFEASAAEDNGFEKLPSSTLSATARKRQENNKEFASWLSKNFDSLDLDKDSVLSDREVEKAVIDPQKANGENAAYLSALYSFKSSLQQELNPDNPAGLEKASVERLEKMAADQNFFKDSQRGLAVSDLADVFPHLDLDGNGHLNPEEAAKSQNLEGLSPEQKQALQDLGAYQKHVLEKDYGSSKFKISGVDMVERVVGDAIMQVPLESLAEFSRNELHALSTHMERVAADLSDSIEKANARIESAKQNPDKIQQGTDGSCFFLVPLQGQLQKNPELFKDMIKENPDKSYSVKFAGAETEFKVNPPTDAELASWAIGKNAAIMEKAFSDYYSKNLLQKRAYMSPDMQAKTNSEIPSARIQGGITADAIKLITGKDAETKEMDSTSLEDLRSQMRQLAENGTPIAADTRWRSTHSGLVSSHCYNAVYDPATDSVSLENPVKASAEKQNSAGYPYEPFKIDKSAADGRDDGKFKLSLAEFKEHFAQINYPKE